MEAFISFLPMRACLILMGVMVWMMNRPEAQQSAMAHTQQSLWSELRQLVLCCVNPIRDIRESLELIKTW